MTRPYGIIGSTGLQLGEQFYPMHNKVQAFRSLLHAKAGYLSRRIDAGAFAMIETSILERYPSLRPTRTDRFLINQLPP